MTATQTALLTALQTIRSTGLKTLSARIDASFDGMTAEEQLKSLGALSSGEFVGPTVSHYPHFPSVTIKGLKSTTFVALTDLGLVKAIDGVFVAI